jgi:hypothetical protein
LKLIISFLILLIGQAGAFAFYGDPVIAENGTISIMAYDHLGQSIKSENGTVVLNISMIPSRLPVVSVYRFDRSPMRAFSW